ncbi:MAG: peptidase M28, partial [Gemmatimonadetes bacterium]|nr:peptidase M28 [Gemmatimonadota bacterium]
MARLGHPIRLRSRWAARSLVAASALFVAAPLAAQTAGPPDDLTALRDIVAAVSPERVEADIRRLAGFGTRHTLSDTLSDTRGIGAARRWIKAEFDEISAACGGCLEIFYQTSMVVGARRLPDTTAIVNVL